MKTVDRFRSVRFDGYRSGSIDDVPVIFLHGWAGSKDIWLGLLRDCPDGFQFISLDLPGTGGTPPLSSFSPEQLARWLGDVADELNLDGFHLVGHSMGGNIAAWSSKFMPSRVRSLTMIAPALDGNRLKAASIYMGRFGEMILKLSSAGAGLLGQIDHLHPHKHTGGRWRSWWRRYRYVTQDNNDESLMQQIRFLVDHPFSLGEMSVEIPIQIIHGSNDQTVSVDFSRKAYLSRNSKSRLLVYSGAMHCPMDEEMNRTLRDILQFIANSSVSSSDVI